MASDSVTAGPDATALDAGLPGDWLDLKPGEATPISVQVQPLELDPLDPPAFDGIVDERLVRPEWTPALPLGTAGWKDSEVAFCVDFNGRTSNADLWADSRGVHVLRTVDCLNLSALDCSQNGQVLDFNDGAGWNRRFVSTDLIVRELVGVFSTGVTIVGWERAGIAFLDSDSFLHAIDLLAPPVVASKAMGQDVVYVAEPANSIDLIPPSVLHVLTPSHLATLGTVEGTVTAAWADESHAIFAGWNQFALAYSVEAETLTLLEGVPAGNYQTAWGFGAKEVWLGNTAGQLAHNSDFGVASGWVVIETGIAEPIEQLWGADGTIFFRTNTSLGRASEAGAELLVTGLTDTRVRSIWGVSSTEVFVAIDDLQFERYACGGLFVTWFDGAQFHPM